MLTALFLGILSVCLIVMGWALWQVKRALLNMSTLYQTQEKQIATTQDLNQQVSDMHQTIGSVMTSLKAMGHQVYNLNQLAGYAIQEVKEAQAHLMDDEGYETNEHPSSPRRILIELRRANQEDDPESGERQLISPEDLPPEMLEKFRTFQAIYTAILGKKLPLPSQKAPELN
jgi:hypothetical protein